MSVKVKIIKGNTVVGLTTMEKTEIPETGDMFTIPRGTFDPSDQRNKGFPENLEGRTFQTYTLPDKGDTRVIGLK